MKKLIKNKKEFTKGYILGAIMFIGIASLAAYTYTANEVTYTPSDTSWNVSDVKSALDYLYIKANTCTVTRTGSNGFSADYNCVGGTGTMTACRYSGTACNGGSYNMDFSFMCTLDKTSAGYLYNHCNTLLPSSLGFGGGMSSSISCSCD